MRKNKVPGGSIVITASASSLYPHQSYPEYSGSKAAVRWYHIESQNESRPNKNNRFTTLSGRQEEFLNWYDASTTNRACLN
jgi:NAD(P)-dependent dehydrogenase (short-subunit alcohol dehydrogenase family)